MTDVATVTPQRSAPAGGESAPVSADLRASKFRERLQGKAGRLDAIGAALQRLQRHNLNDEVASFPAADGCQAERVGDASDVADRRIHARREARGAVILEILNPTSKACYQNSLTPTSATKFLGELIDLSRKGLAAVLLQPLEAGTPLQVSVAAEESSSIERRRCIVLRSIHIGAGLWKIVANFEQPLSLEEVYVHSDQLLNSIRQAQP